VRRNRNILTVVVLAAILLLPSAGCAVVGAGVAVGALVSAAKKIDRDQTRAKRINTIARAKRIIQNDRGTPMPWPEEDQ